MEENSEPIAWKHPYLSTEMLLTLYPSAEITSNHLCGFCDTSQRAHVAVMYLVSVLNFNVDVSFVADKTQVSPLQPLTIPCLELLSAVLLTRPVSSVKEGLISLFHQEVEVYEKYEQYLNSSGYFALPK